jgi:hypothetical protein
MLIEGKCHCGNISFTLDWPGEAAEIPARACGCTFCVKHGGVWTSNPAGRLSATLRDPSRINRYAFGTRTATFHVCAECGSVPFVTSTIDDHEYAVVNVNMFENVEPARLKRGAADFEGEATESRLARRKRGWIPDVRIAR